MWFDDWQSIGTIAVKAVIGYAALVLLLRASGKRTLAKLNAFDMVLVFTVGSILATMILNNQTSIAEGLIGLAMIVGLQFVTASLAVRSHFFRKIIKSDPTLLVYEGRLLHHSMARARVAEVEVLAAMREHGVHDLSDLKAVVLETEGTISVLERDGGDPARSLAISGIEIPQQQQ